MRLAENWILFGMKRRMIQRKANGKYCDDNSLLTSAKILNRSVWALLLDDGWSISNGRRIPWKLSPDEKLTSATRSFSILRPLMSPWDPRECNKNLIIKPEILSIEDHATNNILGTSSPIYLSWYVKLLLFWQLSFQSLIDNLSIVKQLINPKILST